MKSKIVTLSLLSSMFATFSCQKTEPAKTNSDKVATVKDSGTLLAEKKRAKEAEMANLPKPYHPEENAEVRITEIVKQAQKENKNIMIQAGGNWCIWCLRFNQLVQTTPEIKEMVDKNYVYYHLNYSPENKNEKIFAKFGNPGEKFGYPVFIVLNKDGKMIHVQDSSLLEDGKKGYELSKVKEFFEKWVPKA